MNSLLKSKKKVNNSRLCKGNVMFYFAKFVPFLSSFEKIELFYLTDLYIFHNVNYHFVIFVEIISVFVSVTVTTTKCHTFHCDPVLFFCFFIPDLYL